MKCKFIFFILLSILFLTSCIDSNKRVLQGGKNQLALRSMQTRVFETNDKNIMTRTVIATLQDLNFVIDNADGDLGTVSATKFDGYQIKMTVTIRPKSKTMMTVRASARYNLKPIHNPVLYQDFFTSLSKSLFLTANRVD